MAQESTIQSILIADCGAAATKVFLLEPVEDSCRFVAQATAPATIDEPWRDLSVGVVNAVKEIEQITGRRLFVDGHIEMPREGTSGVDAFVITASAAEPLRVVVMGMTRERSFESAGKASSSTYVDVIEMLDRGSGLHPDLDGWARKIRELLPDVVLLVGGVDGGAATPMLDLVQAIRLAAYTLGPELRPVVLYAGNEKLRPVISRLLGDLLQIEMVDNVRPSISEERPRSAQAALEKRYVQQRLQSVPGMEKIQEWSQAPAMPPAAAFSRVVEFLWHRDGRQPRAAVGVDTGAAATVFALSNQHGSHVSVYPHGVAGNLAEWAQQRGLRQLLRWIPEDLSEEELLLILNNHTLHPLTVPQDMRELWAALSIARELLRASVEQARLAWPGKVDAVARAIRCAGSILISGGGLVHTTRSGQLLLAVLDGLQPEGITRLWTDPNQVANALGAAAAVNPISAVSALDSGAFTPLATVISPRGKMQPGTLIARARIQHATGDELDVDVCWGEISIWPVLPGQEALVTLRPARGIDVGFGAGRSGRVHVDGGLIGLAIDARGRPLVLPQDESLRRWVLHRWISDVGG